MVTKKPKTPVDELGFMQSYAARPTCGMDCCTGQDRYHPPMDCKNGTDVRRGWIRYYSAMNSSVKDSHSYM